MTRISQIVRLGVSAALVAGSIDAPARNVTVTVRDTTGNTTVRPGTNPSVP